MLKQSLFLLLLMLGLGQVVGCIGCFQSRLAALGESQDNPAVAALLSPLPIFGWRRLETERCGMELHDSQNAACLAKTPQEHLFQIGDPAESPILVLLPADPLEPQQDLDRRNNFTVLHDPRNGPGNFRVERILLVIGRGDFLHCLW